MAIPHLRGTARRRFINAAEAIEILKRFSRVIFPTLVVIMAIGAFAYGSHERRTQQQALINRARMHASAGPWLREAQSDGGIQRGGTLPRNVADNSFADIFQSDSPYGTFQNVYQLLKDQYVEGVPSDTPLAYGASQALLASLDEPNSRYILPDERKAIDQQDDGVYPGSGLLFTVRKTTGTDDLTTRKITVIGVIPDSPADKAGFKTGDVVTGVNNHWVIAYDPFQAEMKQFKKLVKDQVALEKAYTATETKVKDGITLSKAQAALNIGGATPLIVTVERSGAPKPITATLDVSVPTKVQSIVSKTLDDGAGYIRFLTFNNTTVASYDKAVAQFSDDKGLVLDLRDCPGGQISPAIAIANSLVRGAELGRIVMRDNTVKATDPNLGFGTRVQGLKAGSSTPVIAHSFKGKIVVLVNAGTANTAELLAAFVRDHVGGRVVGETTFGDGMAQTLFPMADGSGFTLTTGVLQTDTGKKLNMAGITPDVPIADAAIRGTNDVALAKADSLLSLPPLKVEAIKPLQPASISL